MADNTPKGEVLSIQCQVICILGMSDGKRNIIEKRQVTHDINALTQEEFDKALAEITKVQNDWQG